MAIQEDAVELLKLAGYSVREMSFPALGATVCLQAMKSTATGVTQRTIACVEEPGPLGALLRSSALPLGSWVVTADVEPLSFPPGLVRQLQRRRVEVLPLSLFFDRMLRAKDICSKTLGATVRWKDQEIDLDRLAQLYIPQRAKVYRDSNPETLDDSTHFASSALSDKAGAVMFILADAGRGKTWLTWSLAHDAAKAYLRATSDPYSTKPPLPPVPFLIPFSQYKRLTSFDGIVLERLNSLGTLDIRAEGFKWLLAKGRIVLILDGFDEMLELAPAHARENLLEIRRHLHGRSKLVLTSRRSVFPSRSEIAELMGLAGAASDGQKLSVCYLEGFTPQQVQAFHLARGATQAELQQIQSLPLDEELRRSPQMAEYFLDIVRNPDVAAQDKPLSRERVFQRILSLIYERESGKWEKEGRPPMPSDLQENFLTEIALVMWPTGSESPDLVQLLADDMGHRYLRNHHLLQPSLDGQLQFEHHVWRDWFMARGLLLRLSDSDWSSRSISNLLANPLPEYCVNFLGDTLAKDRLKNALRDPAIGDAAFSNLLRIAASRVAWNEPPEQRARSLADVLGSPGSLRHRQLARVRLERLDLRDWVFDGTTFHESMISFCTLPQQYREQLRHGRSLQLVECSWWPEAGPDADRVAMGKRNLQAILGTFVMSTEPLKIRDRIAKDKMTRDLHVDQDDRALRCLIKAGYLSVEMEARSEEYYVLDRGRLNDLLGFLKTGVGLDNVMKCVVK